MLDALLLTITPIITSMIVDLSKKVPTFNNLIDGNRPAYLRVFAYGVTLALVLVQGWATGALDNANLNTAISAFLESIIFFLGSQGIYHLKNGVVNVDNLSAKQVDLQG